MTAIHANQIGMESPLRSRVGFSKIMRAMAFAGLCAGSAMLASYADASDGIVDLGPVDVTAPRLSPTVNFDTITVTAPRVDWMDSWIDYYLWKYYIRGGGGAGSPVQPPVNTQVNGRDAEEDECSSAGNPIVRSSGNKIEPEVDFTTNGELPLSLERTYNHYWQGVGLFGKYWVSSFDYKLTFGTTAVDSCYPRPGGGRCAIGNKTVIYAWRPDGRTIKYTKRSDGLFHEDKPEALSTIEQLADGSFVLHRAQGGREAYSSAGYVRYIQDYTTARWTYSYTNTTYPARVIHTSGREVKFTWTNGQLTAVHDPAGTQFSYTYSANVFGTGLPPPNSPDPRPPS